LVRQHYNSRQNQSREIRTTSEIYPLRMFNNWIKTLIFKDYCGKTGGRVFDICGGKGGDLSKWFHADISRLVLADIADNSIKDAVGRYNSEATNQNKRRHPPKAFVPTFICANCHKIGLERYLDKMDVNFDLVSCQFALHYSFESEASAKQFIKNVSCKLVPGGFFVATFPSANRIVDRITKAKGAKKFGNDFYSIEFETTDYYPRFGARYKFLLKDAVDNVTEYLVHHDTLVSLAKENDMDLAKKTNFIDYYTEKSKNQNSELEKLEKKVRGGAAGPLDPAFAEIAGIYNIYVFKKRGVPVKFQHKFESEFPFVEDNDIVRVSDNGEEIE